MIIVDTNVLSELLKSNTHPSVLQWFGSHPSSSLFTTTITQGEMLYGFELLPAGKRRAALAAVQAMFDVEFANRVLPFDGEAAVAYATVRAKRRKAGRPISPEDAQIAAIALSRNAALATRNVHDFEQMGVALINPWEHRSR